MGFDEKGWAGWQMKKREMTWGGGNGTLRYALIGNWQY